ncbi:hypothetical protein [uncultured Duncaniella sp.]|uniref:hypothetical protein n=2 Tax=uncultured Duncaniella sp. TaxID=2768039 RepID=UPI00261DD3E2|nr:hypothetical protein [uncultured Duncaniella sp.]
MTTPLAIFHRKNMNQQASATAQCTGKQQKSQWKFPVSKAFYEKIRIRGERIMDELGYGAGWMKHLMPHIERYMLTGEKLGNHYAYECMQIVFTCLRFEVDLAIERSAKARARAAERRAMKAGSKPATEDMAGADSTPTGNDIAQNDDSTKDMPKNHDSENGTDKNRDFQNGTEENREIGTGGIKDSAIENRSPETDNFKEQICKCRDESQIRKYGYIDESRHANTDT